MAFQQSSAKRGYATAADIDAKVNDVWKAQGELGAKNLIPFPYNENGVIKNNVRFTINNDTSVTVESIGTISGWTQWNYQSNFKLAKGKYIISKEHIEIGVNGFYVFVQDLSNNAFLAQLDDSHSSVEFEVTEAISAHNLRIFINLDPNKTYNTTVYAMLRHAEDQDPTWRPYAPTNYELMKKDKELMQGLIKSATCWGDSLTAMGGWEDTLYNLSGIPFYNAGIGGENSKCIMARQGGDVMIVDEITIPATTTPILIATRAEGGINTQLGNKVTPLLQGGSAHVNPVTIGDITGTLAWTGSNYADPNGTWTFTRATAGEAVVINRPTAIRTNFDINHNGKNELMIIFMGQNDGTFDNDTLIHQHKLMIDHFKGKEYVALGLSSGTAASRADYEAAMKEAFGRRFISLREYLAHPIYENGDIVSCYGLADQNLTPTADDLEKIAIGQVPASCLMDSVHYTVSTREVIGNMLYRKLKELDILA